MLPIAAARQAEPAAEACAELEPSNDAKPDEPSTSLSQTGFYLCQRSVAASPASFYPAASGNPPFQSPAFMSGRAVFESNADTIQPEVWRDFFDNAQELSGSAGALWASDTPTGQLVGAHMGIPRTTSKRSASSPPPSPLVNLDLAGSAPGPGLPYQVIGEAWNQALGSFEATVTGLLPLPQNNILLAQKTSSARPADLAKHGAVAFWDSVPNGNLEVYSDLRKLGFHEPFLEAVAKAAGKAYAELRKSRPRGRLGGRQEPFTQRDLMKGWAKSFRFNYERIKTLVKPELAALVAFHRALEFSYGAGLDYDPDNPKASDDRVRFEKAVLAVLAPLAKELLPNTAANFSGAASASGLLDQIVKKEAGISLEDLFNKAKTAPIQGSKKIKAESPVVDFGPSGAVLRPLEKMRDKFNAQVRYGGKEERIETNWRILEHLYEAVQLDLPPLLVGPTATGKSTAIKWMAAANGIPHLTVSMKPTLGRSEMMGSFRPTPKGLAWQWGFLVKAIVRGDWVTLEEANLAPSEVIEFLNELLNDGFVRLTQFLDAETLKTVLPPETHAKLEQAGFLLKPHPRFRLFLTMNPDFYMGRKPLSMTFANRTLKLWVPDYTHRELELILQSRFDLSPVRSIQLVENVYKGFKLNMAAGRLGRGHKDKYEMNLRSLLRMAELYRENVALYAGLHGGKTPDERTDLLLFGRALWEAVGFMMRSETDREQLWLLMDMSLGLNKSKITRKELEPNVKGIRYDKAKRQVVFEDALLPIRLDLKEGSSYVPPAEFNIAPTPATLKNLYWYARRLKSGQDMLLVGETAAGKTTQIQYLHRLLNSSLYYTNLSADSANEELEGGYQPAPSKPGKFQFVPGQLDRAGREYGGKGTSLFIDEFNLSTLVETLNTAQDDRILMTPEGVVSLGPDTVIIGAMNPPHYQGRNMLSPAVRGRHWEIWVEEPDEDEASLRAGWKLKGMLKP